jgi:hypothetical protein
MGAQNMESLRRSLEEVLAQLDQVSPRA